MLKLITFLIYILIHSVSDSDNFVYLFALLMILSTPLFLPTKLDATNSTLPSYLHMPIGVQLSCAFAVGELNNRGIID